MNLDDMTFRDLRNYLAKIPLDQFPKGNSKFKCKKHKRILSYSDVVSGCWSCIQDEAMKDIREQEM